MLDFGQIETIRIPIMRANQAKMTKNGVIQPMRIITWRFEQQLDSLKPRSYYPNPSPSVKKAVI